MFPKWPKRQVIVISCHLRVVTKHFPTECHRSLNGKHVDLLGGQTGCSLRFEPPRDDLGSKSQKSPKWQQQLPPMCWRVCDKNSCDKKIGCDWCLRSVFFWTSDGIFGEPPWSALSRLHLRYYPIKKNIRTKWLSLVGGLEHEFYDVPYIGNFIIPTDELIFFQRGRYTTNQFWMTSPNGCRLNDGPWRAASPRPWGQYTLCRLEVSWDQTGTNLEACTWMVSKVNSEDVKKWHEITSPVESPSETLILVYRDEKKKTQGVVVPQVPQVPSFDQWHFMLNFPHFHAELRYKKVAFPFYSKITRNESQNETETRSALLETPRNWVGHQCRTSCWIQWIGYGSFFRPRAKRLAQKLCSSFSTKNYHKLSHKLSFFWDF